MAEHLPQPEPPAAEPDPAPAPPAAPRRRRPHFLLRVLGVLAAVVAAVIAATLTIDLGPALRARAESAGTKYLQRPMHIGQLKIVLLTGAFEVDDLVIEGLRPTDRPFLKAKRILINMPWWSILTKDLVIQDVDMSDWEMVVEQFPGRQSFPKLVPDSKGPKGPKRFTTTVRSVIARRGLFVYDDHTVPWSTVARNLNVSVFKGLTRYEGTAQFSNGTIKIQSYEAFRADMQTRFHIDGGVVQLERIDLKTDGATSVVNGRVDMGHWPEMLYNVRSRVDFPIQKEIFFKNMNFTVAGRGDFTGTFHFFKGGRELKGTFTSPEAGVNAWRFPNVAGSLLWIPSKFEVTNVTSGLYGGRAKFDYSMGPFGQGRPAHAIWDTTYTDVDLSRLTDFLQTQGLRLAGRISGRNRLEWPLGRFSEKHGEGQLTAAAPPGVQPLTRQPSPDLIARVDPLPPQQGPFNPHLWIGYVPVAGQVSYKLDPEWITLPAGWVATDRTYVDFTGGRTAWGQRSQIPFHVTSLDWQESDRLLAGIMTAFNAPTGAISIGGRGEFDGTFLEAFTRPRIEGHFTGERMRAWDVVWGRAAADIVIENSYVTIARAAIQQGESEIDAQGKFSLGYPRKDGGEEINAVVRMSKRPLADLRHAFELDEYPVDGLASGEYHIWGRYETPDGFGRLQIDRGTAYGETFDTATANLRFETIGVRLDAIEMQKSTCRITGAAWVAWDGNYSFDANATRIPVESLVTLSVPRAPLSGLMHFTATGTGTFETPRYDVRLRVDDLFAGDEGIGQASGRLSLRGELLTMEVEAASPRLSVTGSGRLALTPEMDTELTLRFSQTSLDPYIRFFQPKLSPFTTAVADGTVHAVGELADIDHLSVDLNVDRLNLKLFDYPVKNDGPIALALNQHTLQVRRFRLIGDGTALELSGDVALHEGRIALSASGDANLGILQGFFRDIRSSGNATLHAQISGPLDAPVLAGDATIADGRLRYMTLPHSLQAIKGKLSFDAQGVRIDDMTAELGAGPVRFGGRVGIAGYSIGDLNLTATGEQMHLRYPEGFSSTVDATLELRGTLSSPVLRGMVVVRDGLYAKRFETNVDVFKLGGGTSLPAPAQAASTLPLRFDIQIQAPQTLRIENNLARLRAAADLTLTGTYDRPVLLGRAEIVRGEILFEGNRYLVTRGTIDFLNPASIEPFIDIEAETRVRVPSEIYRVTLAFSGTPGGHLNVEVNSDPPLPPVDIISLLFGQTTDVADPELRALRPGSATQSEEALLRAALARLAAAPIVGPVSSAVAQTFGVDVVQLSPSLGANAADPLTPTARLTIGKRISNRAYLTYARALGTTSRDQIVVLEYDQNERIGWILTQNGDRQFSIDFRVRRSF